MAKLSLGSPAMFHDDPSMPAKFSKLDCTFVAICSRVNHSMNCISSSADKNMSNSFSLGRDILMAKFLFESLKDSTLQPTKTLTWASLSVWSLHNKTKIHKAHLYTCLHGAVNVILVYVIVWFEVRIQC